MKKEPQLLIIEDDSTVISTLENAAKESNFQQQDIHSTKNCDFELIFSVLSQNLNSTIFIIDRELSSGNKNNHTIIREELSPFMKSNYFIIYTKYPLDMKDEFGEFVGNIVQVEKPKDGDYHDSVQKIKLHLDHFRQYILQSFDDSHVEEDIHERTTKIINTFPSKVNAQLISATKKVNGFYKNSISIINTLIDELKSISTAGAISSRISFVVFGSVGRGEKREKSDIEICIYHDNLSNNEQKSIRTFWNIIYYICKGLSLEMETSTLFDRKLGKLKNDVQRKLSESKYLPFINIQELMTDDPADYQLIRQYQLLTESRPIFNQHLIIEQKKIILDQFIKGDTVNQVLCSNFFGLAIKQFHAKINSRNALKATSMDTFYDIKKLLFRYLNSIATAIRIITFSICNYDNKIQFESQSSSSEIDGYSIINLLLDPGYFKLLYSWEDLFKEKNKPDTSFSISEKEMEKLGNLYRLTLIKYSELLTIANEYKYNAHKELNLDEIMPIKELVSNMMNLVTFLEEDVLSGFEETKYFDLKSYLKLY